MYHANLSFANSVSSDYWTSRSQKNENDLHGAPPVYLLSFQSMLPVATRKETSIVLRITSFRRIRPQSEHYYTAQNLKSNP